MKFPPSRQVPADFDFIIYTKVVDKYSKIENATLTFIDDKEKITKNVRMQLMCSLEDIDCHCKIAAYF